VKKFSLITENKEFLGWSAESIEEDFKKNLSEIGNLVVELAYGIYLDNGDSEVIEISRMMDRDPDEIFYPMFIIHLIVGDIPVKSTSHEGENWMNESIRFKVLSDRFIEVSNYLKKYDGDFHIHIETGGGFNKIFDKYDNVLSLELSLIMKDGFENTYFK
jgi:hypothetical protein